MYDLTCSMNLARMGAEVIKVERPGSGDLARQLGADPTLSARNMGISFLAQNAGKKSVTLNLKHPEGTKILKQLTTYLLTISKNFRNKDTSDIVHPISFVSE